MKRVLPILSVLSFLLGLPTQAFAQTQAEPPVETRPKEPRRGFSMSADAGFAFRQVYGVPIYAGDFDLAFGAALKSVSIYGTFGVIYGHTSAGLTTTRLGIGSNVLFPISNRVRIGVEPRTTLLFIRRVTQDDSMGGIGFGMYAAGTFDIVDLDPWVLYAGVRLGTDVYLGSEPLALLWGGTLSLGARY